ncbi:hypothetical protein BpHYR1_041547 [Brachionus plicatilis]|uniref:Uncharacterized protein n=1 Tax=Brachionus plicatilis TaxID=10195 RepID=A0A3M7QGY7_BRAPC|nr:hypothetical protein BpHYR1_041547 [Brachionus plicatilis]
MKFACERPKSNVRGRDRTTTRHDKIIILIIIIIIIRKFRLGINRITKRFKSLSSRHGSKNYELFKALSRVGNQKHN